MLVAPTELKIGYFDTLAIFTKGLVCIRVSNNYQSKMVKEAVANTLWG